MGRTGGEVVAAGANEVIAAVSIAVSWFGLSLTLRRACRREDGDPPSRSIANYFRGDFPIVSGPVNDLSRQPHDTRLSLDQ